MAQQKLYLKNGQSIVCDTLYNLNGYTYRNDYIYSCLCAGFENAIVQSLHNRANPYEDYVLTWTFPSNAVITLKFTYLKEYKIWDYSLGLKDNNNVEYPVYSGLKSIDDTAPADTYYLQLYMLYNQTTEKFAVTINNNYYGNSDPAYTNAFNMTSENVSKKSNNRYLDVGQIYPNATTDYCNNDVKILGDVLTKPDPYENGGIADSNGVGGNGDFDVTSDIISLPDLPTKSAVTSGFISIYAPLSSELVSLSTYMWSDTFIDGVKKLYANPSDSLIMLGIVPIEVPSVVDSDVKIGGISTGISMHKATAQFIEVDCGTINLNEFFGSCFDYQPYTQLQLYCPFSGYHEIDTDICMSNSLNLRYNFDILSGTYIAYLLVNNSVMYQWSGQALTVLPTSAYNIDALIKGAVATTASVAGAVATGGALAPIAGAMTVASVTSMKPNVSHGGDVSSSAALLSVRQPHIIIKRPRQVLPADYNKTSGYPAMYTATLSDLTGYTEIYNIHLEDMSCTDDEKTEIERLLKEGVII